MIRDSLKKTKTKTTKTKPAGGQRKMIKMLERIKKFQQRARENSSSNSYSSDENIFFHLTEGTHRIRLIGDFVSVHSHWIGPSQYSKAALYEESAFKGDHRIKKNVNCPDFDIDTETPTEERTCTICQLRTAANALLYECPDLDPRQKIYLESIAYTCAPAERTFFLCIDRGNPEVAPGKKGFKIIEFPRALMDGWIKIVEDNPALDCNSDDEGVDFIISKTKDGKKNKYAINYAMKGASACQTPLTEEEKGYQKHDIKKIMGKMPDQDILFSKLFPEFQELIKASREAAGKPSRKEADPAKIMLPKRNQEKPVPLPETEDSDNEYEDDDEKVPF